MSLSELFATDPLKLTREDRKVIIETYRERREQFLLGAKAPKEKAEKTKFSLDDLGDL